MVDADSDTDESTQSNSPESEFQPISSIQCEQNIFERVICAIDFLEGCDIEAIQEDHRVEDDVLAHASILIEFFEGLPHFLNDSAYTDQSILAYKRIVHVTFVIHLFEMRKTFRVIRRRRYPHSTTVKICWTDVVLANLSLLSVALVTGIFPDGLIASNTNSLKCQQQRNHFQAAAQLPESWLNVFSVFASHHSSPAAKRLVMRLLYAVYVLGSRLNSYDPWVAPRAADPNEFADMCLQSLGQSYLSNRERHNSVLDPVHSSILVSLFASVHQSTRSRSRIDNVRPLSLTCVLEAVQAVLAYDLKTPISTIAIPSEWLNPGLSILVKCSNFLPWCWLLWDDHRIAGFECIVYLSVIWLDQLKNCSDDGSPFSTLQSFVQTHPMCSLNVLLQITLHSIDYLRGKPKRTQLPESFLSALGKSVWAIGRIVESGANIGCYTAGICDYMLKLFFYLHDGRGSKILVVTETILESLFHIDDSTFQTRVRSALIEMPDAIQGMVDDAIVGLKRMLGRKEDESSFEEQIAVVRSVMHFVVICWHKGYENCILCGSASTLLNLMSGLISMASTPSMPLSTLLCDLWTTLAFASSRPNLGVSMSAERQVELWDLTVMGNRTSLIAAMSFAHYLTIAIPDIDVLRLAEAWDFLSCIFLMILQGSFPEEDKIIILASPAICGALAKLLAMPGAICTVSDTSAVLFTDDAKAQVIASSPWTKSLADQLRTVMEGRHERHNKFFRTLRCRLGNAGPQLLHQLRYRFQKKSTMDDDVHSTYHTSSQLLYHSSCLLLIPSA